MISGVAGSTRVGVYLFTEDFRLHDNSALLKAADICDTLILLYCTDPADHRSGAFGFRGIGKHRWRFIRQSIGCLDEKLKKYQQKLIIRLEPVESALTTLAKTYPINDVFVSRTKEPNVQTQLTAFQNTHPNIPVHQIDSNTLLSKSQLPFALTQEAFPKTFTTFYQRVKNIQVYSPRLKPDTLPPGIDGLVGDYPLSLSKAEMARRFLGGEQEAIKHLSDYFHDYLPEAYNKTRDSLYGWNDATKLSPWLASGCLSPRTVLEALLAYQASRGASESNRWVEYELYWREYCHWYAYVFADNLYSLSGVGDYCPSSYFDAEALSNWCQGKTKYPLVNACMNQLAITGFMSNRGRQITASCLVNELNIDWRYGAAYFQEMLLDYEVGANWLQWQYISGVGSDPRGGRRINLAKQAELYDHDGEFTRAWISERVSALSIEMNNISPAYEPQSYRNN